MDKLFTVPDEIAEFITLPPLYNVGETCPRCELGTVYLADYGSAFQSNPSMSERMNGVQERFVVTCTEYDPENPVLSDCDLHGLNIISATVPEDYDESY